MSSRAVHGQPVDGRDAQGGRTGETRGSATLPIKINWSFHRFVSLYSLNSQLLLSFSHTIKSHYHPKFKFKLKKKKKE